MRDVRCDDGHDIDAILARRLGPGHLTVIGVAARGIEPQVSAGFDRPLRIGAERAGDQFIAVVEPRGDPVRLANEGATPSADHAEAKAGRGRVRHYCYDSRELAFGPLGRRPEIEAGSGRFDKRRVTQSEGGSQTRHRKGGAWRKIFEKGPDVGGGRSGS